MTWILLLLIAVVVIVYLSRHSRPKAPMGSAEILVMLSQHYAGVEHDHRGASKNLERVTTAIRRLWPNEQRATDFLSRQEGKLVEVKRTAEAVHHWLPSDLDPSQWRGEQRRIAKEWKDPLIVVVGKDAYEAKTRELTQVLDTLYREYHAFLERMDPTQAGETSLLDHIINTSLKEAETDGQTASTAGSAISRCVFALRIIARWYPYDSEIRARLEESQDLRTFVEQKQSEAEKLREGAATVTRIGREAGDQDFAGKFSSASETYASFCDTMVKVRIVPWVMQVRTLCIVRSRPTLEGA